MILFLIINYHTSTLAGIYIHIPFCKQACNYCNFYFSTSLGNKDKFIQSLLREIELSSGYLQGEKIETLYLGGGTPSQLTIHDLKLIMDKLQSVYDLSRLQEFTIETNPDDLTEEKIKELSELKKYGLNRFSIGVQSFFDEDLKYMNRAHNAEEAIASIKKVQHAGFENITIDLIYGTPTMSDENWKRNLDIAFELNVPHISSYALTVEPKTALDKKILKGESKPVDEEQSARQFKMLMDEMRAHSFEQYEISNFARDEQYSKHNSNYWKGVPFLGIGPSAHSFDGTHRRWNISNNTKYYKNVGLNVSWYEEELLSKEDQWNELFLTGLRTKWGVSKEKISLLGGFSEEEEICINNYILGGEILESSTVFLLTKKGLLFADAIAENLFRLNESKSLLL